MLQVLIKSLTREFYRQHGGMFLVGFYVLFGVVEPSQLIGYQKALLLAGISSPVGMAIVFVCWMLYTLKVYFFIKGKLTLKEFQFVSELSKLDRKSQIKLWGLLYSTILLPIIIYLVFLVALSIVYGLFISLISMLIVFGALLFGLSLLTYQTITFKSSRKELAPAKKPDSFKKPFFSWPIFYILKEQRLMLMMCKVLSLLFFKAMLWMFADVQSDIRVRMLAVFVAVLCHAALISSLLTFQVQYLNWGKSLAISTWRRLSKWLIVFFIILIPEWIFLAIAANFNLLVLSNGVVFGISVMIIILTILYIIKLNAEHALKLFLLLFFAGMLAILAHQFLLFSLLSLGVCSFYYLMMFRRRDLTAVDW